MLDTKGPEIRTGMLRDNKPIDLVAGQELLIVTDYSIEGDNKRIACSYKGLPQSVQVGSTIYIADGSLTCEVTEIVDVQHIILNLFIANNLGWRESSCVKLLQTW
jgi:pyruvate kinase